MRAGSASARTCAAATAGLLAGLTLQGCATGPPITVGAKRPGPEPVYAQKLRQRLPQLMAEHNVPGMAIAVVDRDGIEWSAGFGYRRADGDAPVTAGTVFQAASLGKPLFAHGVVRLAEAGALDMDAPLARYAGTGAPIHWLEGVTPSMVLSHTAGEPGGGEQRPLTMQFDPGSEWRYSGAAYNALARVLARHRGDDVEDLLADDIIAPLGLAATSYGWRDRWAGGAAVGHDAEGSPRPEDRIRGSNVAAGLYTTAVDYAQFLQFMLEGGSIAERMLARAAEVDPELGLCWALGWAIESLPRPHGRERKYFFHWGANRHFRAFALGSRVTGRAFVALTNARQGLEIMHEIAVLIDGHEHPIFDFYMLHPTD